MVIFKYYSNIFARMKVIECYDVGGTQIRGAIFKNGKEIFSKTTATNKYHFISQIEKLSKDLSRCGKSSVVSIGVPGPIADGIVLAAPPLGLKKQLNIKSKLENALNKKVFVENDLNLAVKAELHYGYGRIYKNFYLLTLSTGIGSGIVLEGEPLHGSLGEFGHTVLNLDSKDICICGHKGCWAAYSSGAGIEKRYYCLAGKKASCDEVFNLSSKKEIAKQIVSDARLYNAAGIGAMINAFQVDAIIIMGSLAMNQFSRIIPSKDKIKKFTINKIPEIIPTKLGDQIGILGAYIHAKDCLGKEQYE